LPRHLYDGYILKFQHKEEKVSDIFERLEAIRDKAQKPKEKRGISNCVICGTFTEDQEDIICDHP
jgi:hypothetical protein